MIEAKKSLVREHIDRCIELYGMPADEEMKRSVPRSQYEQMRADLMLLLGIASALSTRPLEQESDR